MRSVLSFFSMLALGLMIAAVIMVAPSGTSTVTNIGGPALDYRSVVAGLGIGLLIAIIGQISWREAARRFGGWLGGQARRLWLVGWAAVFVAVLFYF
ncbi:MAG: hypothetical protein H7Y62_15455 [Hyphomicrobium sp.]|nr:hypothetical protein [Hyphomicrobium sp.]